MKDFMGTQITDECRKNVPDKILDIYIKDQYKCVCKNQEQYENCTRKCGHGEEPEPNSNPLTNLNA